MRRVSCYECGKHYDYDDDGFCPHCGAFNQPPKLSGFTAAGALVNYSEGINERNHARSFVHKELHKENRARRGSELAREKPVFRESTVSRSFESSTPKSGVNLDSKAMRWIIIVGLWIIAVIYSILTD